MAKIKVDLYVVGPVRTNCYVAVNAETKECFVVDPGDAALQLAERIKRDGYTPVAICLTHGHFDHAGGAEALAKEFGIKIYAHEKEESTLQEAGKNLSGWNGKEESYHADVYVKDEEELDLAGFHIRVIHTPGHTEGGCCYYLNYEDVLFSGDTLFAQSVGRTDFPGGSMSLIVHSIKEKLMVLPGHTTVYPGHNDATTIEEERMYNPYL